MKTKTPKRILVIRLDGLGDLWLTIPMLRTLRRHFPDARLEVITGRSQYHLAKSIRWIDRAFPAHEKRRSILLNLPLFLRLFFRRGCDAILLPRACPDRTCARILAWAAASNGAVIAAYRSSRHGPDSNVPNLWLDARPEHTVLSALRLAEAIGAPMPPQEELTISEADLRTLEGPPSLPCPADTPLALCAMRSLKPVSNWPVERYAQVADALFRETGIATVLTGTAQDEPDALRVLEILKRNGVPDAAFSLCGQTRPVQMLSLAKRCRLYYGADTAAVHFAAAAGIPCISITPFPLNAGEWLSASVRYYPWQTHYTLIAPEHALPPCTEYCTAGEPHCIMRISAEEVIRAVLKTAAEARRS
jgi:heptosyltransferase-3